MTEISLYRYIEYKISNNEENEEPKEEITDEDICPLRSDA